MNGITQSTALWYASRATGVVSLLLLTGVVLLGILVNRQGRLPGLPRFVVTGLHRNLSLLAVAFVAIHVVTAIADPYVTIRVAAVVIPFASAYQPLSLGLGAFSLDVVLALIVTSLARARMSRRLWRALHWLAYAAWPSAVLHSVSSSTDLRHGVLLYLAIACCLAVAGAFAWRVSHAGREIPREERAAVTLAMMSPRSAPGPEARRGSRRASADRPTKADIR
ncbi:MAG TPA: ferric reductase-like transmembrane domain-containing protein [Streptosporangiaceae bacterium]|nr:ferric reductase-like transmembrane domain-containing protein [Streptosporangiaceae bacterium]